jgi:type I restriction enzyme R subunit
MSLGAHTERAFEDRVEHELLEQGWVKAQGTYRHELGIDTGELMRFIGATQQSWNRLIELYGGDQPTAQRQYAQRLASEIDIRGVLDVPSQEIKATGVAIERAYFPPGHTLAVDALHDDPPNVLTVARQLRHNARDADECVGCVLFRNGVPAADVEPESSRRQVQPEVPDGDRGHRGARSRFGSGVVRGRR